MPDLPTRIVFTCDAPRTLVVSDPDADTATPDLCVATIELEIGNSQADYVGDIAFACLLSLTVGRHRFGVERMIYGYDLRGFTWRLAEVWSASRGIAGKESTILPDWDAYPLLCFSSVEESPGLIAVGGRFAPVLVDSKVTSQERFVTEASLNRLGVVVAFEGLSLDQSVLKVALSDLQAFVLAHEAECRSVWPTVY